MKFYSKGWVTLISFQRAGRRYCSTFQTFLHYSETSVATIPDKIFGTKWSNAVKLDRKRKVWYLFLRVF